MKTTMHYSERTTELIVRVPVTVRDDGTWDDGTVRDSAVDAITAWLDRGQRGNAAQFPETAGEPGYDLDAGNVTVWTPEGFAADVADVRNGTADAGVAAELARVARALKEGASE